MKGESLTLAPDRDSWDRQPGESSKRFGQFAVFRDLGRARTLTKAAETLTISYDYVRQVAGTYRWQQRAAAWDAHQDQQFAAMIADERRRAAEDDARILRASLGKIGQRLQTLDASKLSPGDLVRLLDVVLKHRRILYGDPVQHVEISGPGGDAIGVELRRFQDMPAEARSARLLDLSDAARRRAAALSGTDDD